MKLFAILFFMTFINLHAKVTIIYKAPISPDQNESFGLGDYDGSPGEIRGPRKMAIRPPYLYIADEFKNKLNIINIHTSKVETTLSLPIQITDMLISDSILFIFPTADKDTALFYLKSNSWKSLRVKRPQNILKLPEGFAIYSNLGGTYLFDDNLNPIKESSKFKNLREPTFLLDDAFIVGFNATSLRKYLNDVYHDSMAYKPIKGFSFSEFTFLGIDPNHNHYWYSFDRSSREQVVFQYNCNGLFIKKHLLPSLNGYKTGWHPCIDYNGNIYALYDSKSLGICVVKFD